MKVFGTIIQLIQLVLVTTTCIRGDPQNLVQNGDFELQSFTFGLFPQKDVIMDGNMAAIPMFTVIHGGVQILDANEYSPNPDMGGSFLIHMNFYYGPGVLQSVPLVTPRKGARYHLSFDVADNPDGGPLFKTLKVKILVNNKDADPEMDPFNVSAPQTQRNGIKWERMGINFVGTGQLTTVQFQSLIPGAFGALIDNVNVTLINLIENGSFEDTKQPMFPTNSTFYTVLTAPSDIMNSWYVILGSIKRAGVGRWQPSTDNSSSMLDMNADTTPGAITSDKFIVAPDSDYCVLFDVAANPDDVSPVSGSIFASVTSVPSGDILATGSDIVEAQGYSRFSIGWETQFLEFTATESNVFLTFMSKIPGSDGPLLDNVAVYQVVPLEDYHSVPLTYQLMHDSMASAGVTPSIWTAILAIALGLCALKLFT